MSQKITNSIQDNEMTTTITERQTRWDPPTGQIGIVFDYFEHDFIGSAFYFNTDSYPNVFEPEDIPVYTTSLEERFSNAIDFRLMIQDYNYTLTYYANTQVDDPST